MFLSILEAVAQLAQKSPDQPAVQAADGDLSFAALHQRAEVIAGALAEAGVVAETRVALAGGHSRLFVPSLLAVWRLGATAVPLDDRHPLQRRAFILADTGAQHLVVGGDAGSIDPSLVGEDHHSTVQSVHPQQCAYVIYTSGTTGKPKGVEVTYGGLELFLAALRRLDLPSEGLGINAVSPAFDGWLWCTLMYLLHGQAVALVDVSDNRSGGLGAQLAQLKPRTVTLTPSLLAACESDLPTADFIVVAGEPCPPQLMDRFSAGRRILNAYGPTEATIATTWADSANGDDPQTIGRALPGYLTYVLDDQLCRVPAGAAGELYVGGGGLARGYRGQPGYTAARFLPDPFAADGSRMYRTGDRVLELSDGQLTYLGRRDHQTKVNGVRIEPSEVESVAMTVPGVRAAACAVVKPDQLGLAVVATDDISADELVRAVRDGCRAALPPGATPSLVAVVDSIPSTTTGKLDRDAVAKMLLDTGVIADVQKDRAPTTPREREVCDVFSELLAIPVGTDSNFFDIGGHSLLAAKAVAALRRRSGLPLSMRHLLTNPTAAGLAAELDQLAPS